MCYLHVGMNVSEVYTVSIFSAKKLLNLLFSTDVLEEHTAFIFTAKKPSSVAVEQTFGRSI
jgi:hypothetical protein